MKKFLPLFALVIGTLTGTAQTGSLLINDNFTSLVSGNLNGTTNPSSGWTNTSASTYVQVTGATPLVYSGYTSGTNYITIQNAGGGADDPEKTFIGSTTVTATTSSFYISFVVRVPSAAGTVTANASTRTCFYLQNAGGTQFCNFYIGDNGSGANNLKFGINKTGNTGATFASTNYTFNQTYLVVIRYDFVSGTTNDRMFMWINPSLAAEPATGSADVSITTGTDITSPSTAPAGTNAVNRITIEQTGSGATAHFDGFKMAYGTGATGGTTAQNQAANSAFAWTTLSPAGATLPIKVYYFNAAKGSSSNTVNWQAECTSTQATFVVERSANGTDFTPINTITASQTRCQQPFYYTDNGASSLGTVFYRLKVIDDNGKATYSSIVKISADQKGIQLIGVSPNPVVNSAQLSIAAVKKDNVDLQVISLDGRVVYRTIVTVQPGTSVINIDVTSLSKGMYTIKGSFASGDMNTVKFIK